MGKTIKITNKQQLQCLVNLVAKNPDLGRYKGHHGSNRQSVREAWRQFGVQLNSLGPPYRTGPEWQRVWIHYKANLKRKLAKKKDENGYGPLKELNLSATEEKVFEIANFNLSLNPCDRAFDADVSGEIRYQDSVSSEVPIVTTIKEEFDDEEFAEDEFVQEDLKEETAPDPIDTRQQAEDIKMNLLAKQVETQSEILTTLKKIAETKSLEYDLKKQKFALLQKSEERKSFLRELKIKIAESKLKKKLKNN